MSSHWRKTILLATALLAFAWAAVRAAVQSVTQDEADTYFWFASRSASYIWHPFPNNHILSTLLMWITARMFPLSSFTLRIPALLGAALYIAACYFLCRAITDRFELRWPLLICLLYNPFIGDFMVAARGYSLADGFLLAAIAIPVWHHLRGRPSLERCCAWASLALGLSFAASFSLVFVDAAAFLALLIWALWGRHNESIWRVIGCCVLPGLIVALLLCGYPLAHWPKGELLYGAHSIKEMTHSMMEASLYQLNPHYMPIEFYDTMDFLKPMLLPLLAILCGGQFMVTRVDGSWFQKRWLEWLGTALIGITALAVLLSWLAYRFYGMPMPMTRTGVFLLPICTLTAGVIAAAPAQSVVSRALRRGINWVFIALACYFLLCFRWSYFREYRDGADAKEVYSVLAKLNHGSGVADAAVDGVYVAPLNFYRVLSKKETFPEFEYFPAQSFPVGKSIYILDGEVYKGFLAKQGLAIIYRGKLSGVVVAVRPDRVRSGS